MSGTVVIVMSANGFDSGRILETRVFVGEAHEERARAWGEKRSDWSRHVSYSKTEVES